MVEVYPDTIPAFLQSADHLIYITVVPKSKAKMSLFKEVSSPQMYTVYSNPELFCHLSVLLNHGTSFV